MLKLTYQAVRIVSGLGSGPRLFSPIHVLEYILVDSWPPTPKDDIPEPSHSSGFRETFSSVYVVKGVWSLLTEGSQDYAVNSELCSPFKMR